MRRIILYRLIKRAGDQVVDVFKTTTYKAQPIRNGIILNLHNQKYNFEIKNIQISFKK